jgi:hypothetical protein
MDIPSIVRDSASAADLSVLRCITNFGNGALAAAGQQIGERERHDRGRGAQIRKP